MAWKDIASNLKNRAGKVLDGFKQKSSGAEAAPKQSGPTTVTTNDNSRFSPARQLEAQEAEKALAAEKAAVSKDDILVASGSDVKTDMPKTLDAETQMVLNDNIAKPKVPNAPGEYKFDRDAWRQKMGDEGKGYRQAQDYSIARAEREMNNEFAFYNQARDRAEQAILKSNKGEVLTASDRKSMNALEDWKKEKGVQSWSEYEDKRLHNFKGPELEDYAWGYKAPQLLGGSAIAFYAVDKITGPRSNSQLFSG